MSDIDARAQIVSVERELAGAEERLAKETARAQRLREAMASRVGALEMAIEKRRAAGLKTPAFAELIERIGRLTLPELLLDAPLGRALEARREAARVRGEVADKVELLLGEHAQRLEEASAELAACTELLGAVLRPPDRRRPRCRLETAVDLESDHNFFVGFSANISSGGLFVATAKTLPVGAAVDLRLTLPSGAKLALAGVVRWTQEWNDRNPELVTGLGVQFVDLDAGASHAIEEFIAARQPLFYPDSDDAEPATTTSEDDVLMPPSLPARLWRAASARLGTRGAIAGSAGALVVPLVVSAALWAPAPDATLPDVHAAPDTAPASEAPAPDPPAASVTDEIAVAIVSTARNEAAENRRRRIAEHLELGTALLERGELTLAIAEYKKASAIDASDAQVHRALAIAYTAQEDAASALREYKLYLELQPDSAEAEQIRQIIQTLEAPQ